MSTVAKGYYIKFTLVLFSIARSTYPGRWSEKRAPIIRDEASSKRTHELFVRDRRALGGRTSDFHITDVPGRLVEISYFRSYPR